MSESESTALSTSATDTSASATGSPAIVADQQIVADGLAWSNLLCGWLNVDSQLFLADVDR
jgi:hypothetical protein